MSQHETTRRTGTTRATVIEYLEAGWTDLSLMWDAIERDTKIHVGWNYLTRIAREWRRSKGLVDHG